MTGTGMMKINCTGTDTIRQGAAVTTATTGYLLSGAQGDSITVEAVTNALWHVTSSVGTWTVT